MNKNLKIIIVSFVVITLLFAGGIFYASSIIKPEEVKKLAIEGLQEVLPGADVKLGKVDVSLGLSSTLRFENLELSLKKKTRNSKLAKIDQFELDIPLWAILFSAGSIKLNVLSPHLHYYEGVSGSNWDKALGGEGKKKAVKKEEKKVAKKAEEDSSAIAFAGALKKGRVDIKLNDTSLFYRLKNKSKGKLIIERILLKDLSFAGETAYEIASTLSMQEDEAKSSVDVLLVGQLNLSEFIEKQSIATNFIFNAKNIQLSELPIVIPNTRVAGKATLERSGTIQTTLNISVGSMLEMGTDIALKNDKASIKNLKTKINPSAIIEAFDTKMRSNLSFVNFDNYSLKISGNLDYNLKKQSFYPDLVFESENKVKTSFKTLAIDSDFSGSFRGKSLQLKTNNNVASGVVKTVLDISMPSLEVSELGEDLPSSVVKVIASGMRLDRKIVSGFMEKEETTSSNKAQSVASASKDEDDDESFILPINSRVVLDFRQVFLENEELVLNGSIDIKKTKISTRGIKMKIGGGSGNIDFNIALKERSASGKANIALSNVDMAALNLFLPENIKSLTGKVATKNNISFALTSNKTSYNIVHSSLVKEGELQGINLNDYVKGVAEKLKISKLKDFKPGEINISNKFNSLNTKLDASESLLNLKSMKLVGLDSKIIANGSGKVYLQKGPSQLDFQLTYNDPSFVSSMEKTFNKKDVPVRLKGDGTNLSLDHSYMIATLGKQALKNSAKTQAKKQVEKILEDEKVKKLIKKSDAKKLLKGLFN